MAVTVTLALAVTGTVRDDFAERLLFKEVGPKIASFGL